MRRFLAILLITLLNLISSAGELNAQWVLTNGPFKGDIHAISLSGTNIFAGTLGGGVFRSTDNGLSWTEANSGLGNTSVDAFAQSASNLFAGTYGGVFLSIDAGNRWTPAGLQNDSVYSLAYSGSSLLAGTNNGLYLSSNMGQSWNKLSSGLADSHILSLAIRNNKIFAGSEKGGIYVSSNEGASWTQLNSGLTTSKINTISVLGNKVLAGTDSGVFVSSDDGLNWLESNSGLTNTEVHTLCASGTNIFAGTSAGAYLSTNNGSSWSSVNATFSNHIIKTEEVAMYELFVRDFTNEGTFNAIVPRLQELKDLGINTIWLMPVNPLGILKKNGTYGSPYSIRDYFDVNASMGTKADFKNLVREIHKLGMVVLLDWVANHTAWDNPWISAHSDWYTKDANGNIIPPLNTGWSDVADLNYGNSALRNEMIKAMSYWITEFDIDGYRCDAAEMVPLDFWRQAISKLKQLKPVLMLAEGEDRQLFNQGFNICFSWTEYTNIKGIFSAGKASNVLMDQVISDQSLLPAGAYRLRFTTNHDETSWDRTPPEIYGGLDGAQAASVVSVGLKGIPLIYNGQEVGSKIHLNLFEKMNIDWTINPSMREFYKKLLAFYNSSPELKYGNIEVVYLSDLLVSFTRTYNGSKIWVLVNARNFPISNAIPDVFAASKLRNVFTGQLEGAQGVLNLPAHGYFILKVE